MNTKENKREAFKLGWEDSEAGIMRGINFLNSQFTDPQMLKMDFMQLYRIYQSGYSYSRIFRNGYRRHQIEQQRKAT